MYETSRKFDQQRGLDKKSTDFTRGENYATAAKNLDFLKSGDMVKRYGSQRVASNIGRFGLFPYRRDTGESTLGDVPYESTIIALDKTPKKRMTVTLTVSRAADATLVGAFLSLYFDVSTAQFRCRIYELSEANGEVEKFNLGLGTGEESPAYSVETLKNLINAVTNYTATVDGDGNLASAAFLGIVREHQLLAATGGSAAAIEAYYFTDLNTTLTDPLGNTTEMISAVELSRVLYMANGQDFVTKYDGQTCYRAGMLQASQCTAEVWTTSTGITGINYTYRGRYVQKDAAGNFIEGNFSTASSEVSPTNRNIDVTFNPIEVGSGFNTNRAKVNGNQTGATIVVDAGHTMKVGDTAFLIDRVTGLGEERRVLSTTLLSLTFDSSIQVTDNDMISNNLRLEIYRSKTSPGGTPTTWYFHSEVPNAYTEPGELLAPCTIRDTKTDAQLGDELLEPLADHGRAPNGARYLSVMNDRLIIVGVTSGVEQDYTDNEVNYTKIDRSPFRSSPLRTEASVLWSDVDGPEYFPWDGSTEVTVNPKDGLPLTGGGPTGDGNFAALKNPGVFVLSGDLTTGSVRVDPVTPEVGCVSHHTISPVPGGGIAFLDEKLGPYRMSGAGAPVPLGALTDESGQVFGRIEPVFSNNAQKPTAEQFTLAKACAVWVPKQNKYLLVCPVLSANGSDYYDGGNSVIYAYDFSRDAWLEWYGINAFGGLCVFDDKLWWNSVEAYSSTTRGKLHKQSDFLDAWAYQDHERPIEFDVAPQWQFFGEPSIPKKFTNLNTFSNVEIPYNDPRVNVETEVNFIDGTQLTDSEIMVPGLGYSETAYGIEYYGDPLAPDEGLKLSNGKFLALRPRFKNDYDQSTPVISGYEMFVATPYKVKLKK